VRSSTLTLALLERSVREEFDPEVLAAGIAARRAADWSEPHFRTLEEWYASPRGRALRAAELRASTPEALSTLPAFLSRLSPRDVPRARREGVARIDRATRRTASVLAVGEAVARGLAQGLVALRCGPATSADRLTAPLRARRTRLEGSIEERVSTQLLFAYQDLPASTLDRYAAFLESEAARWLLSGFPAELETTLDASVERLHERLAPAAAARCAAAPPSPGSE
jgi:hypothetical protein